MIRRPPRSTQSRSSAASDVYKRQATHGYMPLFGNDESRRLQIRTGAAAYQHWMGRRPSGFWLPECGYIPGVERLLAEEGLRYFIADAAAFDTGPGQEYNNGHISVATSAEAPWKPWDIGARCNGNVPVVVLLSRARI